MLKKDLILAHFNEFLIAVHLYSKLAQLYVYDDPFLLNNLNIICMLTVLLALLAFFTDIIISVIKGVIDYIKRRMK